ncbi:hypothetical protein GCM10020256_08360 [Streptomyces thermocoprophilus]
MTTAVTPPATGPGHVRITAAGLLRSEWTKLRSVRSLRLTLALSFAAVAALSAYLLIDGETLGDGAAADVPFAFTAVYPLGVLALTVLGVLVVTGEYSSGTVRASMIAAPRRTGVLLAKAAVLAGVTTALGALLSVALYVLTRITGAVPAAAGMSLFDPAMSGEWSPPPSCCRTAPCSASPSAPSCATPPPRSPCTSASSSSARRSSPCSCPTA